MGKWSDDWSIPSFAKVKSGTPVNAVAASYKITALEFALLDNDDSDTITVDDNTFTKVASGATGNEFEDLAGLVALIDNISDLSAASTDGDTTITITYDTKGVIGNGIDIDTAIISDTTGSFNDGVTASTATITEEDITEIDNGDIVEFDGNTFTKVASGAGANEFTNSAGLLALLDALTDWGAADSSNDIVITYKDNTTDKDGIPVDITYYRETANGVNGTIGKIGDIYADDSKLYVLDVNNTISDANWNSIDYS